MFRAAPVVHSGELLSVPAHALIRQASWFHQLIAEPPVLRLLLVLLGIDGVLITVYVLISGGQYLGMLDQRSIDALGFFSVTRDGSLPEIFNHVKEAIMLLALVLVWIRSRQAIYLAWSVVMLLILGDDALRIHENMGQWISQWITAILPAGWDADSAQTLGETVVWVSYAMLASSLLWCGHKSSGAVERANSWAILAGVLLVSVFAVGVDAFHSIVVRLGAEIDTRLINGVLGLMEDGGEMLMLSLTCAVVLSVYRQNRRQDPQPHAATA